MSDINYPTQHQLVQSLALKPSLYGQYWVKNFYLHHVVILLIKEGWFSLNDHRSFALLGVDFWHMVPEVLQLMTIDFSPLREPRFNYDQQTELEQHRICCRFPLLQVRYV